MNPQAKMLKDMDNWLRQNIDDEELFVNWLLLMPDNASDEDFRELGKDKVFFNECTALFAKLVLLNDCLELP